MPPVVTPGATDSVAPSDAIVLFNGSNLSEWVNTRAKTPAGWTVANGVLTVNKAAGSIETKRTFTNYQLHIEWRIPENVTGKDQGAATAVFLAWTVEVNGYEIQVLDSYNNTTYVNGTGGEHLQAVPPLVNAMRKPGEWQSYDVIWTAPTFNADGSLKSPAYVTAFHNGVLVQNHVAFSGVTKHIGIPDYKAHGAAPI